MAATIPPIRQRGSLDRVTRARLQARERELVERIQAADRAMAAHAAARRDALQELDDVHQQLWPPTAWPRGRRPGRDQVTDPLPPLPEDPVWLWGRRLRAVCLRLLHRCGTLPLRQLHALLHLHGFGVAGEQPVKVLADALGEETDQGRAVREGRGRYRAAPGYRPPPGAPQLLAGVRLPDLDDD